VCPAVDASLIVRVENARYLPHVFERLLLPRLRATSRSVLLLGPRQVGKSTLLGSKGLLLEHFIAQELHRRTGTLWPEARLFHYRTKHGAEVDFVVEVGRDLWGIEVKSARTGSSDMVTGLASLADRTKRLKRKILVCTTDRRARLGDVEVIPIREFLKELPP